MQLRWLPGVTSEIGAKSNVDDWDEVRDAFEGGASVNSLARPGRNGAGYDAWDRVAQLHPVVHEVDARAHAKAAGVDPDADKDILGWTD